MAWGNCKTRKPHSAWSGAESGALRHYPRPRQRSTTDCDQQRDRICRKPECASKNSGAPVKSISTCVLVFEGRWVADAKAQNRNGLWGAFDVPIWGERWDTGDIADAIFSLLRSSPPAHGLFMSDKDWQKEVLAHLRCKSMLQLYQRGFCFDFEQVNADSIRCIRWSQRTRKGFTGDPSDVILCRFDTTCLKELLNKLYEEQVKPGAKP